MLIRKIDEDRERQQQDSYKTPEVVISESDHACTAGTPTGWLPSSFGSFLWVITGTHNRSDGLAKKSPNRCGIAFVHQSLHAVVALQPVPQCIEVLQSMDRIGKTNDSALRIFAVDISGPSRGYRSKRSNPDPKFSLRNLGQEKLGYRSEKPKK